MRSHAYLINKTCVQRHMCALVQKVSIHFSPLSTCTSFPLCTEVPAGLTAVRPHPVPHLRRDGPVVLGYRPRYHGRRGPVQPGQPRSERAQRGGLLVGGRHLPQSDLQTQEADRLLPDAGQWRRLPSKGFMRCAATMSWSASPQRAVMAPELNLAWFDVSTSQTGSLCTRNNFTQTMRRAQTLCPYFRLDFGCLSPRYSSIMFCHPFHVCGNQHKRV